MKSPAEGREINVRVPDDLPLVLVDAELIQMVIRELIDNALKYSPAGTRVEIGARLGERGVVISVADHGPGVPEEDQVRIFDKFYRSHKEVPQIKGTGMGLAIAREILQAHSGEIWCVSSPGSGSEFAFLLPIAPKDRVP
jgi:two-component system, OmpR family, sensor histidine kinase KdpD